MTELTKQQLYWASQQGRWVCARCSDLNHLWCEKHKCNCGCRDPMPPRKPKLARDRNGLSEEERRDQINFPYDDFESLRV
jgi:hypothetical protein